MKILLLSKPNFIPTLEIYRYLLEGKENVTFFTGDLGDFEIYDKEFDLGISVHYRHILNEGQLGLFKYGVINIHPSCLPYGRGSDPAIQALLFHHPAGVTVHWMDEGIDTGNILFQITVEKRPFETGEELYARLIETYPLVFDLFWIKFSKQIENGFVDPGKKQDGGERAKKRKDILAAGDLTYMKETIGHIRALQHSEHNNVYVVENGRRYNIKIEVTEQ